VIEELLGVPQLGLEIMLFNARGKLDFLDLARRRFRVRVLLLLLVNILAEIHDAAHRRGRIRRHLDQIQAVLQCKIHGLRRIQNPQLLALWRNYPNCRGLDAMIAANGRERVDIATLIRAWAAGASGRERSGHQ